jgi:hypothetical protein
MRILKAALVPDNPWGVIFHVIVDILVLIMVICMVVLIANVAKPVASVKKSLENSWFKGYNGSVGSRKSITDYLSSINKTADTVMVTELQVATANYGGIYTEFKQPGLPKMSPWHGIVDPDAVKTQIEAGARAIIFDIWPNPADFTQPVVASMVDQEESNTALAWWKNTGGLKQGITRYSNWNKLTRNVMPAASLISTAVTIAGQGRQGNDPFFLILNMHGRMPKSYLDGFGTALITALQGKQLSAANMVSPTSNINLCTVPISTLMNKVFVIVNPDVPAGMTREAFNAMFYTTKLAEATNLLTTTERPTVFKMSEVPVMTMLQHANCAGSVAVPVSLPAVSLCCIQPSIGETYTDNDSQFRILMGFSESMKTGAQFVGVNVFGGDSNGQDSVVKTWHDPKLFGSYSFKTKT